VNLLVGTAAGAERSKYLARLAAAWCAGAILSPVLTSVWIAGISPPSRLSLFALLFLLPFVATKGRGIEAAPRAQRQAREPAPRGTSSGLGIALLCVAIFLVYGGIEASIASWIPMFALRYSATPLFAAQWLISAFWLGLMLGRIYIARIVTPPIEHAILRVAIIGSACCLGLCIAAPSAGTIWAGSVLIGVCLSPLFPLMLSASIAGGLSVQALGAALAACGLGAAMFPSFLDLLSSFYSLRTAMLLPLVALGMLLFLSWRLTQLNCRPVLLDAPAGG
jgi:fucose permease